MFFSETFLEPVLPNEGQTNDRLPLTAENVENIFLSEESDNSLASMINSFPPAPGDQNGPAEIEMDFDRMGDGKALVESLLGEWDSG